MQVRSIRRRDFIAVSTGAAAWPLAVQAQQPERIRRVGVLLPFPESDSLTGAIVTAFAQALGHFGWVQGKNIRIDYRFAGGDPMLIKAHASELIGLSPEVILASTLPVAAALQRQTRTIPIVFVLVVDPVGQGFVQSLARPGGNITGFGSFDAPIIGKWPQLLKEIASRVTRIAVIFNPDIAPYAPLFNQEIEAAALSFGMTVVLAPARNDAAIEEAIAAQAREPGGGLICLPDVSVFYACRCDHRRRDPARTAPRRPAAFSQSRWSDLLLVRYCRRARTGGRLYRPHPQRRQPGGPAGSAADEIFADHQPQGRQGARPHCPSPHARPRR